MCCFPLRQSQANRGPACAFWGMITAAQPGNWHHDRFRRAKKTALGTSGAASARQTQPHANLLLFYFFDFLGSGAGTRTKKRGALHRTVFPFLSLRSTGRLGQEGVLLSFSAGSRGGPPGRGPLSANESRASHSCSDNKRRFLQQKIRVLGPTLWLSLSKVDDCPIRRRRDSYGRIGRSCRREMRMPGVG